MESSADNGLNDEETPSKRLEGGLSRRLFLRTGSLTVAAAGLLSAAGGSLPLLLSEVAPDAPEAEGTAADITATEPIVVQLRDLATGDMSVYVGEQEIRYRDAALASRIAQATR